MRYEHIHCDQCGKDMGRTYDDPYYISAITSGALGDLRCVLHFCGPVCFAKADLRRREESDGEDYLERV
jgi:hypothetical protein